MGQPPYENGCSARELATPSLCREEEADPSDNQHGASTPTAREGVTSGTALHPENSHEIRACKHGGAVTPAARRP